MDMTTNGSMDPSSGGDGLGHRPREHRLTPLRHCMDKGGTEVTVFQTKVSAGLLMIFPLQPAT